MASTVALDDSTAFPRGRAIGYDTAGAAWRISDYGTIEQAKSHRLHLDLRTVGAGGIYSTLRDLAAWDRALDGGTVVDPQALAEAVRVHTAGDDAAVGIDSVSGYGYGWIVSRRYGTDVVWHDGGFAGFRNIVLRVPARRFTVVILSNSALIDQHRLATTIADHFLTSASKGGQE